MKKSELKIMWSKRLWRWIALFFIVFITSCTPKSKIQVQGNGTEKGLCTAENIKYKYFSAKAKATFETDTSNQEFSLHVRMQKGKNIWVRASKINIEGMRCLFTPDSVKIKISFPDKIYLQYTYEELSKMINSEVSYEMLENLILGNLITSKDAELNVVSGQDSCLVTEKSGTYTLNSTIQNKNHKISKVSLMSDSKKGNITLEYSEFETLDKNILPTLLKANVHDGTKTVMNMILEVKNPNFDSKKLSFPFSVSSNYETR